MSLRASLLLLLAVTSSACRSTRAIVRLDRPELARPSGPPRLERAIDLGAMPLAPTGELSAASSDGWLTPGEWVALLGSELSAGTQVQLGGRTLPVQGWLEGGSLLVRVPRGLTPGRLPLTVDNGVGQARLDVEVNSFVWGADTRGDSLRFRLLGATDGELGKKSLDLPFEKARFASLSPEGGLLFALQEPNYGGAFTPDAIEAAGDVVASAADAAHPCDVIAVDMGGRGGPVQVGALTLELSSRPTALTAGPRHLVAALERRHLLLLDVADPAHPRVLSRLQIAADGPPRELVDAEFLDDGRKLVVLEAYENQLHLVDVTEPSSPRLAGGVSLASAQPEPFSIDLAAGGDGKTLFALQGPNLRLAGKKLKEGVNNVWNSAKVGFKVPPGAGEAPVQTLSRVVEVELKSEGLQLVRSVPLPADVFPFFVARDPEGFLYVSALHAQNPFNGLTASLDGVMKLLEGLRDTAQFSRVIRVDPRTAETSTVLQSMAIYYEVTMLPTGRLLASLIRLGPGYIPPRVTLDWGFEIVDGQFVKLREVANTAFGIVDAVTTLLPPYRYERVGAQ